MRTLHHAGCLSFLALIIGAAACGSSDSGNDLNGGGSPTGPGAGGSGGSGTAGSGVGQGGKAGSTTAVGAGGHAGMSPGAGGAVGQGPGGAGPIGAGGNAGGSTAGSAGAPTGMGGAPAGTGGTSAGGAPAAGGTNSMGGSGVAGSGGSGGSGGSPVAEPDVIDCATNLAPAAAGVCDVAVGTKTTTVIRGRIVAPDHIYAGGEIVLDATGNIACVACDCSATAGYVGATTLTCADGVVTPALINAHEHLTYSSNPPPAASTVRYDYRNQWRKGLDGKPKITVTAAATAETVWFGALRHVLGGVGSISGDEGTPKPGVARFLDKADPAQGGLGAKSVDISVFPLGDSSETSGQYKTCANFKPQDTQTTIDADDAYEPHVSEGVSDRSHLEFTCLNGSTGASLNAVKPQTAMIHAVALTPADIETMATNNTALVWSPRSNISLYGFTASVTTMSRAGVQIALGTDWTPSGSMSLLRELACASSYNTNNLGGFFSDYQLYRMVTEDAVGALNRDTKIGRLQVGHLGDITIWNGAGKTTFAAVTKAENTDVALVLRAGVSLVGEAAAVDALSPDGGTGCEALTDCLSTHKVCAMRETGVALAALQTAAASTYPLFFCGAPMNEPSCVPSRPGEFTGVPGAGDMDGDGVADATDLCPNVFDPPRPMDGGKQADADADGVGDACDPCPNNANTTACTGVDPNDSDGDGIPNATDNCPMVSNADQLDTDMDGKGDLCDSCPMTANPGAAACPATIYDIKSGKIAPGATVALSNKLVTGLFGTVGFYLQSKMGDPDYAGTDNSGIYVFTKTAVKIGDRIDITTAMVQDFHTQIQLDSVTLNVVSSTGEAAPDPVIVVPTDVATGGPKAGVLESVIIEVDGVDVTDIMPVLNGGDKAPINEFVVTGNLRVNDGGYLTAPFPTVGQHFSVLRGVLDFRNADSKLEPRSMADETPLDREKIHQGGQGDFGWGLAGPVQDLPRSSLRCAVPHFSCTRTRSRRRGRRAVRCRRPKSCRDASSGRWVTPASDQGSRSSARRPRTTRRGSNPSRARGFFASLPGVVPVDRT